MVVLLLRYRQGMEQGVKQHSVGRNTAVNKWSEEEAGDAGTVQTKKNNFAITSAEWMQILKGGK